MKPTSILDGLKRDYVIPCFQREYAWGEEEIEGLINSIEESNDDFCLGIVTVKRARNNGKIIYKLIDGQQRITTLYLIAIHCGIINIPASVRLTSEYEELTSGSNNLVKVLNKSDDIPRKMQDGYRVIERLIPEAKKTTIKEKFKRIYYYEVNLDKNINLNHYFEVMNSRGVQLSRSDIVKSLIMNKLDDDNDKKRLNRLWYKFEKMDSNNDGIKNFKQFQAKGNEYKTINEILKNRNIEQTAPTVDAPEDENSILNFEFFLLYVVRLYQNIDDDSLDSSGEFNLSDLVGEYETLLREKNSDEVISFLDFMVEMKTIYNKYIVKYDSASESWSLNIKNNDMLLIQSCLRVSYINRRIMHWIYMTMKFFYQNKDVNLYIGAMRNYMREQVKDFLEKGEEVNYRTGFNTPNIVLNYLDILIMENYEAIQKQIPAAKGLKIDDYKFKFRNSIEHFMPRHREDGTENPAWVDDFGNLALLAYKTNTKMQNARPDEKATHFNKELSGYSLKLQIMSKITLKSADGWNKERSDELTKIMIQLLTDDVKTLALLP